MGSLVTAARKLAGVDGQQEVKARMEILLVAAKAKLQAYRAEINEQFINPASVDRIQIPGIRAIRFIEQYHVASSSSFSTQVSDHLQHAIEAFFSIGGKGQDTKDAVQKGIKELIATGLSGFIGSTEAGETEDRIYVVVPENNTFVRADIYAWKYQMTDKALGENSDTATAYVLCKSVIDHTKLKLDELIYLVSESLSKRPQYVDRLVLLGPDGTNPVRKRFYADPKNPTQPMLSAGAAGATEPTNDTTPVTWEQAEKWREHPDGALGGDPPQLAVVEGYIDELVRVWNKLKQESR